MTSSRSTCTIEFAAPYTEHIGTKATFERLATGLVNKKYDVGLLRFYEEWDSDASSRLVFLDASWSNRLISRVPYPWKKFCFAGVVFNRFVKHFRKNPPDVLITGLMGGVAIVARDITGVETDIIVSVQGLPQSDHARRVLWPQLYPRAEAVVVPVESMVDRVAGIAEMNREDIEVVPNPVVTDSLIRMGTKEPTHQWFGDFPTIVAVGRQTTQKDFETLLRAFAEVVDTHDARLIIPGKQDEKSTKLREIVRKLSLRQVVSFPGFVENPYAYIRAADVFALSSRWEGPGHVLIEALALGTPTVATDCPLGPREVLQDGDVGELVPVGDHEAMAMAIKCLLDDPSLRTTYAERGESVSTAFSVDNAVAGYNQVVERLCPDNASRQ